MDQALSPAEYLLLLVAFHATRSEQFDISVIRHSLAIAKAVADSSEDVIDFRTTLELMVAKSQVDQVANPALA